MATSFITNKDLEKCGATSDDVSGVSEILNSISEAKFSLVLSERDDNKVKGSLRSEEYKGVDVSKIARQFKGNGHKLASGFEIEGRIQKNKDGWTVE
jgi:phosphoesterase RecJ-like protein